jgi:hypothetical protein
MKVFCYRIRNVVDQGVSYLHSQTNETTISSHQQPNFIIYYKPNINLSIYQL